METANYHSKAKALLDYLTSQGYSKKYVSQFRLECERVAERLPLYGSFEQYIAEYPASFGLTMYKTRLTVIRLIRSYFEDEPYDKKQQGYLQTLVSAMIKSLKKIGAEKAVYKSYNALAVNVDAIDCDYYRFQELDAGAVNAYQNEYMSQYYWADFMY